MPHNQPKFSSNAHWNPYAVTIVNETRLPFSPTRIFVSKNNTWYVSGDGIKPILSGIGASGNLTTIGYGGYSIFVSGNGDMYTYDDGNTQVNLQPANSTSSEPVMIISSQCNGLFLSANNTLYCSVRGMHEVVTKSLLDSMNTLRTVAGTGCYGSASNSLAIPNGIFVDLNFTLYVADSDNKRIQRFLSGETNAVTMAGNGAPGTITLNYPTDVSLDGDGYLFIVDSDNHRIIGSGPNGFRCVAGCLKAPGSASTQLKYPQSMSFDSDGNIWVADRSNGRIQKFILRISSSGTFHMLFHVFSPCPDVRAMNSQE